MKRNAKAAAFLMAWKETDRSPIVGYKAAGDLYGDSRCTLDVGQVMSTIDYACFLAGIPCLSLTAVLAVSGDVNDKSFDDVFRQYKAEMVEMSSAYHFTDSDIAKLLVELANLKEGAVSCWGSVIARAARQPGFIPYYLDRARRKLAAQMFDPKKEI